MCAFGFLIFLGALGSSQCQAPDFGSPLLTKLKTFAGGTYEDFDGYVYAANETVIFSHKVRSSASAGLMTFADFTSGKNNVGRFIGDNVIIRYYIDDDVKPLLEFVPGAAAGSFVHLEGLNYYTTKYDPRTGGPGSRCQPVRGPEGVYCGMDLVDSDSNDGGFQPWMTKWSGKLGPEGSWTLSFRIPFSNRIRITAQIDPSILSQFTAKNGYSGPPLTTANAVTHLFSIFRGVEGDEASLGQLIKLGGAAMPPIKSWNVRLRLLKLESFPVKPLDFVPLANISIDDPDVTGGALFMTTTNWRAGTLEAGLASPNVQGGSIEGCWWALLSPDQELKPGMATPMGSGIEDYFGDSYGFGYFSKIYHSDISGLSHVHNGVGAGVKVSSFSWFSAYRYFDNDPVTFDKRFFLTWRNGAATRTDPAGHTTKCFLDEGGQGGGSNQIIDSYVWVYTWKDPALASEQVTI